MAREEQPDQFTKSVPLSGGMQDDVPEYLQEFPSMAYVENGRFRKTNEVEKTLPETENPPLLGIYAPPGKSVLLQSSGDTLLAIGPDASMEYSASTGWRLMAGDSTPLTVKSDICSTAQAAGAMNYSWAESVKTGYEFFVVAYETRSGGPTLPGPFTCVVETFTAGGTLLKKTIIDSGRSPQVNVTADGRVVVHYCLLSVFDNWIEVYDTSTETSTRLLDTGQPLDVTDYLTSYNSINSPSSNLRWDAGGGPFPINDSYNPIRGGFSESGTSTWFKVHYPGYQNGEGLLFYADKDDDNALRVRYVQADGTLNPFTANRLVEAGNITNEPQQYFLLDVKATFTGSNVDAWVIYGHRNPVAIQSSIIIKKYTADLATEDVSDVLFTSNCTISNASIGGVDGSGDDAWVAYTRVDGDETDLMDTRPGACSVRWGHYTGSIFYEDGELPHHRLTSNILVDGADQEFTVEQFGFFEPATVYGAADTLVQATVLPGIKPTTSILVRAGGSGETTPICTFDATTSKHTPFGMQEQNPHLAKLTKWQDEYFYCNRQLLQGEDTTKHMMLVNDSSDPQINTWHLGMFRGNLFRVDANPDRLSSAKFGESVILNTGIPLWYAGGDIVELSVLEQPEIRYIDTTTPGATEGAKGWSYVEPFKGDTDEWAIYQIIMGYSDSNGQLHRSAPSIPIYVWDLNAKGTNTDARWLGFTRPITSFADDRNYFIEVYSGQPGEPMKLAKTQNIGDLSYLSFQDSYTMGAANYDPARTSEIVYTGGGELAADPWPSFDQAVVTSRRMFAVEGSTLYFSKLLQENIAPEFNAVLTIPFGRGRKLRAIGKIDDKIIVFEKDTIHAVYGEGPDNLGEGDPFIVDHLQTTVGCADPESIIEIPEGLLFYSSSTQEFHMVSRDLEVVDIGKAVQDLTQNIDIQTAIQFPAEHEVRWYVTGGPTEEYGPTPTEPPTRPPRPRYTNILPANPVLVFNYHYAKWTVLSDQEAITTTMFEDNVVRMDASWNVFHTSLEWANSKLLKYRLPWFRTQNLQSFGRIRDIDMLGKYLSAWKDNGGGHEAGDIKVTSRYDYEADGLYHEYLWKANQDLVPSDGDRLQVSLHPGKPKAQAIQIMVEEVPTTKVDDSEPTYTNGRGFVLSGLDLVYSIKRGLGSKSLGRRRRK